MFDTVLSSLVFRFFLLLPVGDFFDFFPGCVSFSYASCTISFLHCHAQFSIEYGH